MSYFYFVYSPTSEAPEFEVQQFYSDLSEDIHTVGQGQFPFTMGDFNAILTIISGHAKNPPPLFPSRNSGYFEEFLIEHNVVASSTQFQKKNY